MWAIFLLIFTFSSIPGKNLYRLNNELITKEDYSGVVYEVKLSNRVYESLPRLTALAKGDSSRIYRLSFPISSLVALQTGLDGFLAVEKHLLVKQGIFRNTIIRSPVGFHLDEETKSEVDRLYEILYKVVVETQS